LRLVRFIVAIHGFSGRQFATTRSGIASAEGLMRWLGLQVTVMVSWTPVKFSVMLHTPHNLFNMLNKLW